MRQLINFAGSFIICVAALSCFQVHAQDWWDQSILLGPWTSWYYTPLPGVLFTHTSDSQNYPWEYNELQVTIPKPGYGLFRGYSTWVWYDYTWTVSPPLRGRMVNCFLGIPYAAIPNGQYRFQPPRPVYLNTLQPWAAKRYRSACMQPLGYMQSLIPNFTDISEDCLYLNLFYPNVSADPPTLRYPVMIHIHGASPNPTNDARFSFSVGSSHLYPGHALASCGVVVVTFNYRLGPLGWLSTQDFASLGNYGLWDQVEAMKWVRDNIYWFRGDTSRVTLFGDDTGAASVGIHLVSPVSRGRNLYHQTILVSGSDLDVWAVTNSPKIYPKSYTIQVAQKLGCPTNDMYVMVHCLRYYKTAQEIVDASVGITSKFVNLPVWGPVVDGEMGFIPRMTSLDRSAYLFEKIPMIIGLTKDEGAFWAQQYAPNIGTLFPDADWTSGVTRFLLDQNVARLQDTLDELSYRYTWWGQPDNETARRIAFTDLFSDFFYGAGVNALARYQALFQPNVYKYLFAFRSRFDSKTAPWMGVPHGSDWPYIWGLTFGNQTWFDQEASGMTVPQVQWDIMDTNVSEFMMVLFTNFAKYGNPTPWVIRNCTWFPFQWTDEYYLHVWDNCSLRQRYHEGNMEFWTDRFKIVADPLPIIPTLIPFPIYDYQIATFVLAFLCLVGIGVIAYAAYVVSRKPDVDQLEPLEGDTGPFNELQPIPDTSALQHIPLTSSYPDYSNSEPDYGGSEKTPVYPASASRYPAAAYPAYSGYPGDVAYSGSQDPYGGGYPQSDVGWSPGASGPDRPPPRPPRPTRPVRGAPRAPQHHFAGADYQPYDA